MSNFFYADKATRGDAFAFPQNVGLEQEVDGDQSSRLHPTPVRLDNSQKVGSGDSEPSPAYSAGEHAGGQ